MPMFYNKRDSEKIIIEPDHGVPLCNCCSEQVGSMVVLQGGVSGLSRVHFSRVCKAFVMMRLWRDKNYACVLVLRMMVSLSIASNL